MDLVQVSNLYFGYPTKKDILKNISLKIEEGSFTCIVGENGSGKTSFIKCLVGLNKNYEGKMKISGKIGYLPQKTQIQSHFPASVEEVVLSGTLGNSLKSIFYKKDDKIKAKEALEQLGIYDIRKKCFADLSGGQQQRVLIARCLCAAENIIILDEPTNGLDPHISNQIYKLLKKLNKEEKITILMVSHDVERALKFADKVVEFKSGKISFCGTPNEYKNGGEK